MNRWKIKRRRTITGRYGMWEATRDDGVLGALFATFTDALEFVLLQLDYDRRVLQRRAARGDRDAIDRLDALADYLLEPTC